MVCATDSIRIKGVISLGENLSGLRSKLVILRTDFCSEFLTLPNRRIFILLKKRKKRKVSTIVRLICAINVRAIYHT